MNTPKIADYTTRKSYQQNYDQTHREQAKERKRRWRERQKLKRGGVTSRQESEQNKLTKW